MDKYDLKRKMIENSLLLSCLNEELKGNNKDYQIIDKALKIGPIGIVALFSATGVALANWWVALMSIPFVGITSIFLLTTRSIIKRDIDYTSHMINKKNKLNQYYLKELSKENNKVEIQNDVEKNHDISLVDWNDNLRNIVNEKLLAKLGITYEEFDQLDINEQHRLIEQANGKELRTRVTVNGMLFDQENVRTIEYVDERIDQICSNKPKCKIKKI